MSEETFEVICNDCRRAVRSDLDVCPNCGAVLFTRYVPPNGRPSSTPSPQPKPRRRLFRRQRPR